jgi:glycosyltransferase involved in cell wall biosynthesis
MQNASASSHARVQVFIPVYNDVTYFPRAVASVLDQQGVDVELVVSDNASTDGTYEYICAAAASDPRIIVHRNPSNIGHTANLNRFADYVTAGYFMLLCSDDMLGSPTALRRASEILDRMPDIVSVYSDLLYVDGHDRKLAVRRFKRAGVFDPQTALRESILTLRNVFGIPLLNRRSACIDLRYPADMNYVGDICFSMQMAQRGRVFHIPEPLIFNRYTGKNLTAALLGDSTRQFKHLMTMFDVSLSGPDLIRQTLARGLAGPGRRLFLRWARWRTFGTVRSSPQAALARAREEANRPTAELPG